MHEVSLLVPIVFLLSLCVFFSLRLRYRHLDRLAAQETIRGAIERGQPLTPELVVQLIGPESPNGDLRRGAISIAIAGAIAIFAVAVGEDDALAPLTGIASFPLLIGIAYLGLHWFSRPRAGTAV